MLKNPLFSVVIANYNNGRYLMSAIDSVRNQTYSNWEIIIVDDCSVDESFEVYKQLNDDNRIHIFYNEKNQGVGYTKHKAVQLAKGEIIGVLDPDDFLEPKALEWEVDIHLQHPEVSIIYSKVRFCDVQHNIIDEGSLPNFAEGETYFDHRCHGAMNFASFKKAFYNQTEGIGQDLRAGDDQDLYFKLEEVGKFYCLDKFTYNYVVKGNESSLTSFGNYANQWYGDLKARYRTCLRRGLNPDDYIPKDLQKILDMYATRIIEMNNEEQIQKLVESKVNEVAQKKADEVRTSHAYRLGKFLLKPFSFIRKHISR